MVPYVTARLPGVTTSEPITEPIAGRGPTRGWCPGVLDPMEAGDGWLLRIRVPGGFITAPALDVVAEIAAEFGSGIVDITSRANLQIRGVPAARLDDATAAVTAAGLVCDDARRDAFRAVVSNPVTGHDPSAVCDSRPVVEALVARLVTGIMGEAPSKFGIVVDDSGSWPLDGLDADLAVRAHPDGMWAVHLRGVPGPVGHTDTPVDVAEAATQLCVDRASRMNQVVAALEVTEVLARLGLRPASAHGPASRRPRPAGRIIGVLAHNDANRVNVVAAPFLARASAEVLRGVAALAATHDADLRLTPDHSLAFCAVHSQRAGVLLHELRDLGLVVAGDDPRAAISACVGSAGCLWAHADTLTAGTELAATGSVAGRVHLSACAKQCGAPAEVRQLVADATGAFR